MTLSIIILNYNVGYFLEQCIQSVQHAIGTIHAEIIVIDNASTDHSCAMVSNKFPSVRLIKNKENIGFPKGNNQGAAIARGEYLCILNPDTVVAEDTFIKVLRFIEEQKNPGIVGVKLIDGTGEFLKESKRGVPTPWTAFTKFMGWYRWFPKWFGAYYAMHLDQETTGEVAVLTGAFMVVKRSVYQKVNGFDEGCFMYSDDIDLSYRIENLGYSNYYFSHSTVLHYKGESTRKDDQYLENFRQAMYFFYKKHYKVNHIFDIFLHLGVQFFSLLKLLRLRVSEKRRYVIERYFLISDNVALQKVITQKTSTEVVLINKEELLKRKPTKSHTGIIFDGNQISNVQIITLLEKLKNKNYIFKIRPKNCSFILGSNHRDAKGKLIIF